MDSLAYAKSNVLDKFSDEAEEILSQFDDFKKYHPQLPQSKQSIKNIDRHDDAYPSFLGTLRDFQELTMQLYSPYCFDLTFYPHERTRYDIRLKAISK